MSQEPTLIAVAVVEQGGSFLVGLRPLGVPLAGYREFPGGKVEAGESPAEAAVRECREETGVTVEIVDNFPEHVHEYQHDRLRLLFFHCRPTQRAPQPRAPFEWVPRGELGSLRFPAGNAAVLALLQAQD